MTTPGMTLDEEIDAALCDLVDRVSTEGTAKRRIMAAIAAALDGLAEDAHRAWRGRERQNWESALREARRALLGEVSP